MRHVHASIPVAGPLLVFYSYADHRNLHSFPTRRSSDLNPIAVLVAKDFLKRDDFFRGLQGRNEEGNDGETQDRKSTRLNSSHLGISYAVFCLKKKNAAASRAPSAALWR